MSAISEAYLVCKAIELGRKRLELKPKLLHLAVILDSYQHDIHIARTTCASGGVVGGSLAIAGFAASFFTMGTSLLLTGVGVGIGVASGLGGIASLIAEKVIHSEHFKSAQVSLDEYVDMCLEYTKLYQGYIKGKSSKELSEFLYCAENSSLGIDQESVDTILCLKDMSEAELVCHAESTAFANSALTIIRGVTMATAVTLATTATETSDLTGLLANTLPTATAKLSISATIVGKTASKHAYHAVKGSFQSVGVAAKIVTIGGVVVSVLAVGVNLADLVMNSIKVHKNQPSEVAQEIRSIVKELDL